jgi:hypothetical protein
MRLKNTTGLKRYSADRAPGKGSAIRVKPNASGQQCMECRMWGGLHLDTCQTLIPRPEQPLTGNPGGL